jgi:hypothetical protein
LPAAGSEREASSESSSNVTPTHQNDGKSVLSPQKPVNLLPEVPIQSSRKLSDKEQRDCEVIGMHFISPVATITFMQFSQKKMTHIRVK